MTSDGNGFDINAIAAMLREQQARREKWGALGAPINAVVSGHRKVAVHNTLLSFPPEATYHSFLRAYIEQVFGEGWWGTEMAAPAEGRHQLISWALDADQYRKSHENGETELRGAPMSAASAHLIRLAYNLHQIKHLGLLQESLVKRLKCIQQFQGACYEVDVTAAFVRGGFNVALEPEGKSPEKVCEFVATHQTTLKSYSVEAKSRHVAGVLGQAETCEPTTKQEPHVSRLIRKALEKTAAHDRVICVDVNFPVGPGEELEWRHVVRQQVLDLESAGHGPAMLIFTNFPFHYLKPNEAANGHSFMLKGLSEPRFRPSTKESIVANFPGLIDAMRGFQRPVPWEWE